MNKNRYKIHKPECERKHEGQDTLEDEPEYAT